MEFNVKIFIDKQYAHMSVKYSPGIEFVCDFMFFLCFLFSFHLISLTPPQKHVYLAQLSNECAKFMKLGEKYKNDTYIVQMAMQLKGIEEKIPLMNSICQKKN